MKKILLIIFFGILIPLSSVAQPSMTDSTNTEDVSLLNKIEIWYENHMNYCSITGLMVIESSFIPFPSEIVIPPAAYIASKQGSDLNIFLVVLFGTIGAMIGACINYCLALFLGRPIIYKFADSKLGRICLLSSEKVQKAEDYFNKHGKISTFVGRLIPGIRQLISIPAGLARMNFASFAFCTFIGAGIWNAILALIGYVAQGQSDLINQYSHELSYVFIALFGVALLYFVFKYILSKK